MPFLIFTVFLAAFALLTGFATLTVIVAFFPALVSVILAEEPFVAFLGTEILIFLLLVTLKAKIDFTLMMDVQFTH